MESNVFMSWLPCGCLIVRLGQGKAYTPCAVHQLEIDAILEPQKK